MLIVIALCFSGCLGFYEAAEDKLWGDSKSVAHWKDIIIQPLNSRQSHRLRFFF